MTETNITVLQGRIKQLEEQVGHLQGTLERTLETKTFFRTVLARKIESNIELRNRVEQLEHEKEFWIKISDGKTDHMLHQQETIDTLKARVEHQAEALLRLIQANQGE